MGTKRKKFFKIVFWLAAPVVVWFIVHTMADKVTVETTPPPQDKVVVEPVPPPQALDTLDSTRRLLLERFDSYLTDPEAYARLVADQCAQFPEGDLFPYVFVAMAYSNLALAGATDRQHAREQIATLIDLALPAVIRRLRPPENKLEKLESYGRQATYLGQLNLALGCYRLIGGDERFDRIHRRISDILYQALVKTDGRPLDSFPNYSWPFDTIPVLASLKLDDLHSRTSRTDQLVKKHLAWLEQHGRHESTGLPYSRLGKHKELPRGCDLSLRLCLLAQIDRSKAEALYQNYTKYFWLERGIAAGFAEWPRGISRFEDNDSGPIILGIGTAASGLGIGTVIAMNDQARLKRLADQMAMRDTIFALLLSNTDGRQTLGGMIPFSPEYFTGFLFGDAILFYAITWQAWEK
ncbi:MAG: hypothetical protein JRJ87_13865 [Deltaproteobacteria bacterium]|nr:hypothetical protein [Deltaproteobacteria bacterium]